MPGVTVPTYTASLWISPTDNKKEGALWDRYEWRPFSVDEVRYSRTENGEENWQFRWVISNDGSLLKSRQSFAAEWHEGTNHDGLGWELRAGFWNMVRLGKIIPFPIELIYEKVTRTGHDRERFFVGSRWRGFLRADFWWGTVDGAKETGFTGQFGRPLVRKIGRFAPVALAEYDSFEGLEAKMLFYFLKEDGEVKCRLEGGYVDKRWGEGWTAGLDWRF